MIRRTLQGGLLAAVAMFALVPTAAVAVAADQAAPAPVAATVPHHPHTLLPAVARQTPVRHRAHRSARCRHHVRHHRRTARVTGRVATRYIPLNVRSGPGLGYRVIGHRRVNGRLALVCKTYGSYVYGNPRWYRLAGGSGYVSARYVRAWSAVPWC